MKCSYPIESLESFTSRFCALITKLKPTVYSALVSDPTHIRRYYIKALPEDPFSDLRKKALVEEIIPNEWKDISDPTDFLLAATDYVYKQKAAEPSTIKNTRTGGPPDRTPTDGLPRVHIRHKPLNG